MQPPPTTCCQVSEEQAYERTLMVQFTSFSPHSYPIMLVRKDAPPHLKEGYLPTYVRASGAPAARWHRTRDHRQEMSADSISIKPPATPPPPPPPPPLQLRRICFRLGRRTGVSKGRTSARQSLLP